MAHYFVWIPSKVPPLPQLRILVQPALRTLSVLADLQDQRE